MDATATTQPTFPPAAKVPIPVTIFIVGVIMALFGVVGVVQTIEFGLVTGDPTAFYAAAVAVCAMGVSSVLIGVTMFVLNRPLILSINALLWPQQLASVYLVLQFALESRNPGSGTMLGVLGIVGFLLGRFVSAQLRRAELISGFFPDLVRAQAAAESAEAGTSGGRSIGRAMAESLIFPAPIVDEHGDNWVRANIESIIIAFIMALVIRTFALEAFKIPTGSMKPTLDGDNLNASGQVVRWGDKILVSKFLYLVAPPKRWEIIVFKYPLNTKRNFIKRLIGLPEEQLLIYRGDIWTRPTQGGVPQGEFELQRKPDDVQEALWMPFYSYRWAIDPHRSLRIFQSRDHWQPAGDVMRTLPLGLADEANAGLGNFTADWIRVNPGRSPQLSNEYVAWDTPDDSDPHFGTWSTDLQAHGFVAEPAFEAHGWATIGFVRKIFDRFALPESIEAYMQTYYQSDRADLNYYTSSQNPSRQVGDIRVKTTVTLDSAESRLKITLWRGDERNVLILGGDGSAEWKVFVETDRHDTPEIIAPTDGVAPLADRLRARGLAIRPGVPVELAFSNADRRLRLSIDGVRIEPWDYPVPTRATPAAGINPEDHEADGVTALTFGARGGKVAVAKIEIDRDIHYFADGGAVSDPGSDGFGRPRSRPIPVDIGPNNYFGLGDNTRRSKDSRLWYGLKFELADGRVIKAEPDPTSDSLSTPNLLIRPSSSGRGDVGTSWINTELATLRDETLQDLLRQMQQQRQHRPISERLIQIEDITGVVQTVDVMEIQRVTKYFAFAIPHDHLIGRALFRFLPLEAARFVR